MTTQKPLIIRGLTEKQARDYFDKILKMIDQEPEEEEITTLDRINSPSCLGGLLNID